MSITMAGRTGSDLIADAAIIQIGKLADISIIGASEPIRGTIIRKRINGDIIEIEIQIPIDGGIVRDDIEGSIILSIDDRSFVCEIKDIKEIAGSPTIVANATVTGIHG